MKYLKAHLLYIFVLFQTACHGQAQPDDLPFIQLPPGFRIAIYADDVENARSLALGSEGTVFVGTRSAGKVYALVDKDHDQKADTLFVLASRLNMPNGVAFRNGDLYVAEINRILVFRNIESRLNNPPAPEVIFSGYPSETHHGWKFIRFGPDGKLYVPVGAPCNICLSSDSLFATITRINPDGTGLEIFAKGIRNSVGFDWQPGTGELWFTDNGRDWMGDNRPPDELNHAPRKGLHFGYPFCHVGDIPDPEYGKNRNCEEFTPPVCQLGAHVAPLGMRFYTDHMFPEEYRNQIFIAEHGSWNRTTPVGYRITLVRLNNRNQVVSYKPFATGWLNGRKKLGRPVDLLVMPDGSLLVSDDYSGKIYRIYYEP